MIQMPYFQLKRKRKTKLKNGRVGLKKWKNLKMVKNEF